MDKNKIGIVILAAGKGTRLGCTDKPKVMLEIGNKPIVSYIVSTLEILGFSPAQVAMVVGFHKETVMDYFGERVSYAVQEEQKGTAHAAYTGMLTLPPEIEHVLVIQGDDSAFYTPKTIQHIIDEHIKDDYVLSLITIDVVDPASMGRVIRDTDGKVEVVEKEYTTDEQKKIKEISTGTFMFNRKWFETMFPTMPMLRKLGEYGLPTALAVARESGAKHQVIKLEDSSVWFGVNTPEELAEADRRKRI